MRTRSSQPRIAVVGGGIGGLAAAAHLHAVGLECTVYEQASAIREVGAGLVLAPNVVRLLRRLGVFGALADTAVPLDVGWEFRRWEDGRVLSSEDLLNRCQQLFGERTYTVHRADLLSAIASAVPTGSVRLGHRLVRLETRGAGTRLHFEDGSSTDADVVVGADGVHSLVRGTLTRPEPPVDSGMVAYRAIVPSDRAPEFARARAQTLWLGPGHHLVHYPISGGAAVNLVAFAPARDRAEESWSATASVEEFSAEFAGWDPRLTELIEQAGTPGRWALLDRAPLARWSAGPVTLLGDAAHPMFPFFAQGAAQSIEDAAVLARCLHRGLDDVPAALVEYESRRRPRTTRLQQESHARAETNHLPDGADQQARDAALSMADPLVGNAWIYGYDPDDDDPDDDPEDADPRDDATAGLGPTGSTQGA